MVIIRNYENMSIQIDSIIANHMSVGNINFLYGYGYLWSIWRHKKIALRRYCENFAGRYTTYTVRLYDFRFHQYMTSILVFFKNLHICDNCHSVWSMIKHEIGAHRAVSYLLAENI